MIRIGIWLIVTCVLLVILTVVGMINGFNDISGLTGSAKASALAKSVSINLWYTVVGVNLGIVGSILLTIGLIRKYRAKPEVEKDLS